MPSSTLTTKAKTSLTLSDAAKDIFRAVYQSEQREKNDEDQQEAKIKVNDIISKMSFFYEKIRNAVDYKEEHLLRKNAIERILKRLLMMRHENAEEISQTLLIELIRAAYLANDIVPEKKVGEIAKIIERFLKLRRLILAAGKKDHKEIEEIKNWLANLTATSIEESLDDHQVEQAIGKHMFDIISKNIIVIF
ncbi:MAG: hypothetical protein WCV41_04955, partial [Patescibacteria group bacterium]